MAMSIKFRVFWEISPSSHVKLERRFRCVYCLHHQGDDDGGSMHIWNVSPLQCDYTALYPRRLYTSLWGTQIWKFTVVKQIVISHYSSLQSIYQHYKRRATWNLVLVVTTGWCSAIVHQNGKFTVIEKEKCVFQFEQNHSATLVQQWFVRNYGKEAPTRKFIFRWQIFCWNRLHLW
jgi:hypothetical protein